MKSSDYEDADSPPQDGYEVVLQYHEEETKLAVQDYRDEKMKITETNDLYMKLLMMMTVIVTSNS